eukprot:4787265-Prymnesium_polylepis.1
MGRNPPAKKETKSKTRHLRKEGRGHTSKQAPTNLLRSKSAIEISNLTNDQSIIRPSLGGTKSRTAQNNRTEKRIPTSKVDLRSSL